jgi:hypothetical protein
MHQLELNFGGSMTKQVRIENADTAPYKLMVETWDKGFEGSPDSLVATQTLSYPTAMSSGLYVTSTRYIVVREAP